MADDVGYGTGSQKGGSAGGSSSEKGFVDRAWDAQHRLEKRTKRIGSGRYARVLKMARKPEPEEFRRTSIIVAVGLLIIGFIGFVIFLLMDLLSRALGVK